MTSSSLLLISSPMTVRLNSSRLLKAHSVIRVLLISPLLSFTRLWLVVERPALQLHCPNLSTSANLLTKRIPKCKLFTHVSSVQSESKSAGTLTTKSKNSPLQRWKDLSKNPHTFTPELSTHGRAETKKMSILSFLIFIVPMKCSTIITTMPSKLT